jgi:tetratricopeptide (TPR) repeat protein
LEQLRRDRDHAKAAAEKAAGELAKLKSEPTSALYQQTMSLFLKGQVEEALEFLDEKKLRHSLATAKLRNRESDKEVADAVQAYLLRAQLLTTRFRFDNAEDTYQAVIAAAPENMEAQFALADFYQKLNRLPKALTAYLRALELARHSGTQEVVAKILNGLGLVYEGQSQTDEARQEPRDLPTGRASDAE